MNVRTGTLATFASATLACVPVEYVLQVRVLDASGKPLESVAISPAKLDLPIGYWKWARDREFR